MRSLRSLISTLLLACCASLIHAAPADDEKARTVIHMLDYVGVDYPQFVKEGKVLDETEYQEQREFAAQSLALLEQLPAAAGQAALVARARQLLARIDARGPGPEVSELAAAIRGDVIRTCSRRNAPPAMARRAAATVRWPGAWNRNRATSTTRPAWTSAASTGCTTRSRWA
jgi:high-affinity iron transporter